MDPDNDADQLNMEDRLNWALDTSKVIIDAKFFDDRYVVPFTESPNSPPLIKHISSNLVGVLLYDTRRVVDAPNASDQVSKQRDDVQTFMQKISAGQMRIIDTAGVELPPVSLNIPITAAQSGGSINGSGAYVTAEQLLGMCSSYPGYVYSFYSFCCGGC